MAFLKMIFDAIVGFFTFWPTFKPYLDKLISGFQWILDYFRTKQLDSDLNKADDKAQTTKDTTDLENIFKGISAVQAKQLDVPIVAEEKKKLVIAPTGLGIYFKQNSKALSALSVGFSPQKTMSVGIMSFGSSESSVILAGRPEKTGFQSSVRMGSKILGFALIIFISMGASSCNSQANRPNYAPKLWAGDSGKDGISRSQDGGFIPANTQQFDGYVCLTYHDLACTYKTYVDNSVGFKKSNVDCSNIKESDGLNLVEISKPYQK